MTLQPIEPWPGNTRPGGLNRLYTGQQTARAVGLSWQRFRKVRADWTRTRDFPAELNEPGEPVRYLADAVDRWVERRSRRVHAANPPAGAETARFLAEAGGKAAAHGRQALRQLKGTA